MSFPLCIPGLSSSYYCFWRSYFDKYDTVEIVSQLHSEISGILRLSTKYNILPLRTKAIAQYLTQFPSTLQGWDAADSNYWDLSYIIELIVLFRETNALECLPSTMYICSRFSMYELLHGHEHEHVNLSSEDNVACIMGREELIQAQEDFSYSFVFKFNPPADCQTSSLCAKGAKRNMHNFHHKRHNLTNMFALQRCTDWSWMQGICPVCMEQAQLLHKSGRRAVWELLPKIFDLGSWEEIEKAKQYWNDN